MWWEHGGWGAGNWLAMILIMVLFWGLVIVLVVSLGRRSSDRRSAPTRSMGGDHAEGTAPDMAPLVVDDHVRIAQLEREVAELRGVSIRKTGDNPASRR